MGPWFKFYAAEYLLDPKIAALSFEHRGVLLTLWCLTSTQSVLSLDHKITAKQIGIDPRTLARLWVDLRHFFTETPEGFISPRMVAEREKANVFKAFGEKGGRAKAEKERINGYPTLDPTLEESAYPDPKPDLSPTLRQNKNKNKSTSMLTHASGAAGAPPPVHAPPQPEPEPLPLSAGQALPDPCCGNSETGPERPKPPGKAEMPEKAGKSRKPRARDPTGTGEQTLAEILGGGASPTYNRYWKLMGVWPKDKNPAPRVTARAWLDACKRTDPLKIFMAAVSYRDRYLPPHKDADETRYMKSPLVWLREEGYEAEIVALENPELIDFAKR